MWRVTHAQMCTHCGIFQAWMTNSFIALSVSSGDVGGPYHYEEALISTFSHNPQVRQLPDGTYTMCFIGVGPRHRVNANNLTTELSALHKTTMRATRRCSRQPQLGAALATGRRQYAQTKCVVGREIAVDRIWQSFTRIRPQKT